MLRLDTSVLTAFLLAGVVTACAGGEPGDPTPTPTQVESPAEVATGTGVLPPSTDPPICAEAKGTYAAAREPSNVLFVYDRSGSMHIKLPGGETRWQATSRAFFELLPSLPETTGAGLMFFPQGDAPVDRYCRIDPRVNDVRCDSDWPEPSSADRCNPSKYRVSVASGRLSSSQVQSMRSAVTAADDDFYWGTPLATAVKAAIAAQRASTLPGAKSIILLTDGNPTSCGDSGISNRIANVVEAAEDGLEGTLVRTFVVGLVDSARQAAKASNLSKIAAAGGTKRRLGCEKDDSCFYKLTDKDFVADLKTVFDELSLQAFACTFNLPAAATNGADPARINVQISSGSGARTIPRDASRTNGWDYLPGGRQIQLYGQACSNMKDAAATLRVVVGCPTVVVNVK